MAARAPPAGAVAAVADACAPYTAHADDTDHAGCSGVRPASPSRALPRTRSPSPVNHVQTWADATPAGAPLQLDQVRAPDSACADGPCSTECARIRPADPSRTSLRRRPSSPATPAQPWTGATPAGAPLQLEQRAASDTRARLLAGTGWRGRLSLAWQRSRRPARLSAAAAPMATTAPNASPAGPTLQLVQLPPRPDVCMPADRAACSNGVIPQRPDAAPSSRRSGALTAGVPTLATPADASPAWTTPQLEHLFHMAARTPQLLFGAPCFFAAFRSVSLRRFIS